MTASTKLFRNSLCCVVLVAVSFCTSCRKDEPEPQPAGWNEDWALFQGTLISSTDTVEFGFSSNQGAYCSGYCHTDLSPLPWSSEARYSSSIENQYYRFEVKRGVLNFNGSNFGDLPDSAAFTNYFTPCYDSLTWDLDYTPGVEIRFTDINGIVYSSTDWINNNNSNYQCLIRYYHPFTRNGVQYVKVKMFFTNILLQNASGDLLTLLNCEYEGYFVNQ